MANTITSSTFTNTYKDDYLDSDGYYRVLFNSGVALQARELTQLQTIINKQFQRFGDNLFKEGAAVKAGSQGIDNLVEFIKLQDLVNFPLPETITDLIGRTYEGASSGIRFEILDVIDTAGSDPAALYVRYTNTLSATDNTVTPRVEEGEILEDILSATGDLKVAPIVGVDLPTGLASKFNVDTSIHYTKGFFVYAGPQSIYLSKFSNTPTAEVGFQVVEDVVTVADDEALYDNQGSTPNISAPGADRYRIRLILTTKDQITSGQSFLHIATVRNGVITKAIDEGESYAIPRDLIALRIKENSGDYLVKPFTITFSDDSDNDFLILNHSDGIAVVEGYRSQVISPGDFRVPKAQAVTTIENEIVPFTLGNYIDVLEDSTSGVPNIDTFQLLTIKDAIDFGGSTIGTCRVRAVNETNIAGTYRYYLFNIRMNTGSDFGDAKSIGTSNSDFFNPIQTGGKTVLQDVTRNTLLFPLSQSRPQTMSGVSLSYQKRITQAGVSGGSEISITGALTGNEVYSNIDDWILAYADSAISAAVVNPSTTGSTTATLTPPAKVGGGTGTLEVLAYVNNSNATIRQKNLATRSITVSGCDSDGSGFKFIDLHRADGYDVLEILESGDSSVSYANRFTFDNGQRENYYDKARLILKSDQSDPGATFIKFRHFTHTAGNVFTVKSYDNITGFTYADIPSFARADGTRINLRNYVDFRPVADSSGNFISSATGAAINFLPQPNDIVEIDEVNYYLSRNDRLVINEYGNLIYIQGSDGSSAFPKIPEKTLHLYNIKLNPNTLNRRDTSLQVITNKRYTMKDIAALEKRVDKIEEYTTLNLLEIDTLNQTVLDETGNDRTKSGFFADNFTTHVLSDTRAANQQYRASIDPINGALHPLTIGQNIRLIYDSDRSTNTIRKGDNVYLKYTEEVYVDQSVASKAIKINPFTVSNYAGHMEISPSSDTWHDYERVPRNVVDGGIELETNDALLWGNWEWNWNGLEIENLSEGSTTNVKTSTSGRTTTKTYNKVAKDYIVEEFIEDRVVFKHHVNKMRSNKIYFKATGLRPNTRVFAFFNNVNVSDFVKKETFQYYSDYDSDYSQQYKNITEHPDGKTATLTTEADGSMQGSFFIPSTDALSFDTGTASFKLLDISVANDNNALSKAAAVYVSTGQLYTRQEEYLSTRVLDIDGIQTSVTNNPSSSGGGRDDAGENERRGGSYSAVRDGSGNTVRDSRGGIVGSGRRGAQDNSDLTDPDDDDGNGGGGGCVIATYAESVGSELLNKHEKRKAEIWCIRTFHGSWWGEAVRKGYRYTGNKAIREGKAEKHFQEFIDYVNFGRGDIRNIKTAWTFFTRTAEFFVKGLTVAKKEI